MPIQPLQFFVNITKTNENHHTDATGITSGFHFAALFFGWEFHPARASI